MINIINEINESNSLNYKISTLKKHKDNELFKRVLKMAYDKVTYSYGITTKNTSIIESKNITLTEALDLLEFKFCTREYTGHKALEEMSKILGSLNNEDRKVIEMILDRDLKINIGKTVISKIFPGLVVKPPYMRCEVGTEDNIKKNMDFSKIVYSQKKEDGTFRYAIIDNGITIISRPGYETEFPIIEEELKTLNINGIVLTGELTLRGEKDRQLGNGLINSDNPPHDDIIFTVWDMIPLEEFRLTKDEITKRTKNKQMSLYSTRFNELSSIIKDLEHIRLVESRIVKNMKEAYEHFQELTSDGFEGTVIKSGDLTWKDGNSKQSLKVKLIIELDMRITGFTKGTGKNEDYFGAITYQNDEGTIKGQVGVSSMDEKTRDYIHEHRDEYVGQVMTLHCNNITKARDKDTYSLSHPRYIEFRGEKETDTLERSLEQKEMVMNLL